MTRMESLMWLSRRMEELGIEISVKGRYGTIVGGDLFLMTDNHLKSLLRRDYIEKFGNSSGVNRLVENIIEAGKYYGKTWKGEGSKLFEKAWSLPT